MGTDCCDEHHHDAGLATAVASPPASPSLTPAERDRLVRRVLWLSWFSLAWMTAEGAIGLFAAWLADSPALLGFGIDSAIEGLASVVIVWRFTGGRAHSEAAERRAQQLVAVQFFLFAPWIAWESAQSLLHADAPDASWIGIALASTSLVLMPMLGRAKMRLGDQLGSVATRGEGRQNMLCAYLAASLLVGLVGNAVFGLWWLDPVVGLVIAGISVQEGRQAWRGEGCC